MENYIAILDSGLGGVSVLRECLRLWPEQNYIYATDSLAMPIGNKSKKYILSTCMKLIDKLREKYNISMVVLACNTMTTAAIDTLRKKYADIDFVGTEPCIKLAKDRGYKKVLVVATPATTKNSIVLQNYITKDDIIVGDKNLAKLIEDNRFGLYRLAPYISKKYQKYMGIIDCVVLGCTHYVFIKELFEKLVCESVLDSGQYVAQRVKTLAERKHIKGNGKLVFCDNGGDKKIFDYFNKIALYTTSKYDIL